MVEMDRRGFSLIELVVVVVIVALLAAMAIPRMSRGASGASDAALTRDLNVLRGALDLYQAENGGNYPTADNLLAALLQYNDGGGLAATYSSVPDTAHIYGPYLQSVPSLPIGVRKGSTGILAGNQPPNSGNPASGVGWIYTQSTGHIAPNTTTETDARGVHYNSY